MSVVLHLYRGEPVDVDMRDDLLREVQRHKGHIFVAVQMSLAGCDDRFGTCLDEVIHDREIVRRKIPKNVDVVLEKAKIDASGIVVIELSQGSFFKQLPDLLHCAGEQEGMVHHDLEILFLRQVDQFLPLRGIARERLLDKYVLAILQRSFCQLIVRPDRSDDGDGVDRSRRDHLRGVSSNVDSRIGPLRALPCGRARLRNGKHLGMLQTREVPHDVWSPVAVPNYTEVYDVSPPLTLPMIARSIDWFGGMRRSA